MVRVSCHAATFAGEARAVSGAGGSNATFRAACIVRDAGFSDGQIVEIVAVAVENVFTNLLNIVAETEIDFPVVLAAEAA